MERLNTSLASGRLASKDGVADLVREQLLKCPPVQGTDGRYQLEAAVERKASYVWELIGSLRSASNPREWKVEEESKGMRVMYKPGPRGTPLHTYCVEGGITGTMPHALCAVWEVPCYKEWWPQFSVPTFRVVESRWLKRIRDCENLFHVRLKVPWPLKARELVVLAFALEHYDENMIIGCLRTVPLDASLMDPSIDGVSGCDLPQPGNDDVVRMEASGGFVLQRIDDKRCYFRATVDLDLKLDFFAPWIINFIGRQLVGRCHRLYQKTVLSVPTSKLFREAMREQPLYARAGTGSH